MLLSKQFLRFYVLKIFGSTIRWAALCQTGILHISFSSFAGSFVSPASFESTFSLSIPSLICIACCHCRFSEMPEAPPPHRHDVPLGCPFKHSVNLTQLSCLPELLFHVLSWEEGFHRHFVEFREQEELACRHAVLAFFVFLYLLWCNTQFTADRFLSKSVHAAQLAQAAADQLINLFLQFSCFHKNSPQSSESYERFLPAKSPVE